MKSSPILTLIILLALFNISSSFYMADPLRMPVRGPTNPSQQQPIDPNAPAVHIIYTEQPQDNEEPESFHIRTLTSVLGSEEAAREALVYIYKNAAFGFSAKLTPGQVSQISALPGVLQVMPSRTFQLHSRLGGV